MERRKNILKEFLKYSSAISMIVTFIWWVSSDHTKVLAALSSHEDRFNKQLDRIVHCEQTIEELHKADFDLQKQLSDNGKKSDTILSVLSNVVSNQNIILHQVKAP